MLLRLRAQATVLADTKCSEKFFFWKLKHVSTMEHTLCAFVRKNGETMFPLLRSGVGRGILDSVDTGPDRNCSEPSRIGFYLHGIVLETVRNGSKWIQHWTCKRKVQFWIRSDPFRTGSSTVPFKQKTYQIRFFDRIHLDRFGTGPGVNIALVSDVDIICTRNAFCVVFPLRAA